MKARDDVYSCMFREGIGQSPATSLFSSESTLKSSRQSVRRLLAFFSRLPLCFAQLTLPAPTMQPVLCLCLLLDNFRDAYVLSIYTPFTYVEHCNL
uniref:Uncharacterized protein n=1 Tax=Steinernema glaseri TaxID=37863 RepID=A0A1I7YIL0_9BILA